MNKFSKVIVAGLMIYGVTTTSAFADEGNGVMSLINALTTKVDNVITALTNIDNKVATLEKTVTQQQETINQQQKEIAQQQNDIAELKKEVKDQLNMIKSEHEFGDFNLYVYDRWAGSSKPASNMEVVLVKYPYDSTKPFDEMNATFTFTTDANGKIHGRLPKGTYQAYARYDLGQYGGTPVYAEDNRPAGNYSEFYTWNVNDPLNNEQ